MISERRRWTWLVPALCGVTLAAHSAAAQTPPCQGAECSQDTTPTRSHIFPALGVRVGTPQKVSVALGVVLGVEWQLRGTDYSRDVAFFVEPGLGASRLSVAYINGIGNMGSGYGVAATVLRTASKPWTLVRNTTYIGGEMFLWPVFLSGPRIGLFRRMSGEATIGRWFLGADFGFGL
jgi:hypothetical protein